MTLNESFELGCGLVLKNRVLFAPISTLSCLPGGEISEQDLAFYEKRSKGVGAIVLASAYVTQKGKAYEGGIGISHNRHIAGLSKLISKIKKGGSDSKVFIQLYHGGAMTSYNSTIRSSFCVSSESNQLDSTHQYQELTEQMIESIYQDYEEALIRAIRAGFDGVEIHAASNYLPYQFLSPSWNYRTDAYGGCLKKRLKFIEELVLRLNSCINEYATSPFALGIRLSETDSSLEEQEKWKSFQTTLLTVQELNSLPLDYIHMASSDSLEEVEVDGQKYSKASLLNTMSDSIPLITCGGLLCHEDVAKALKTSPLVSACRPFIFLPDWAEKVLVGTEIVFEERQLTGALRQELAIPRALWSSVKESKEWYMYQ
ncbi:oxidoreductase [Vagococcus fessus]|uniref:oxidoreductase n=1 Tax=Vagococcus fessus TaxID=120370 RepID=UPI001474FD40|nr:hypothetical protein [Vagococcus fessus]